MKKPTATQRIEQAVKNHDFTFDGKEWYVNGKIAIKLVLAERERLNRGVRKVAVVTMTSHAKSSGEQYVKLTDILTLWEG